MIDDKGLLISETESVKDALKKLDMTSKKILFVVKDVDILQGTVTDGDLRRYILQGRSLNDSMKEAYNKRPMYAEKKDYSVDRVKKMMIEHKLEALPIVDQEKRVVGCVTWSEVFGDTGSSANTLGKVDIPLVIMAGGEGHRLEPFTKILPKPLIPIGDKPMIEIIIDEFIKYGVRKIFTILNYKGEMIDSYFRHIEKNYEIVPIWEKAFLGTAGGLSLIEDKIDEDFLVSNCDVMVKANFEEVLNFHRDSKAAITILSSIQHYKIPHGIIKFRDRGEVIDILEKPEYTFTINTGVYLVNREALRFIPKATRCDMTDLIKTLTKNGKKVITYPVNENDYIDVGQWEDYKKAIDKLQRF